MPYYTVEHAQLVTALLLFIELKRPLYRKLHRNFENN